MDSQVTASHCLAGYNRKYHLSSSVLHCIHRIDLGTLLKQHRFQWETRRPTLSLPTCSFFPSASFATRFFYSVLSFGSSTTRPATCRNPSRTSRRLMARTRRVIIIGAGSSGLAAVQQALDARLEPVCIEANPGVGGAWRYDADAGECKVEFDEHGMAFVSSPKVRYPSPSP